MRFNQSKNKTKQDKKQRDSYLSWKQLLQFYRQVKIPWGLILLTTVLSFGVKQVQVLLVPYTSQIQTGAITEHGFLGGFIAMTITFTIIEAVQGGVNELTSITAARNARQTVWHKMLHLPMSYYDKHEPQSLVSRVTNDTNYVCAGIMVIIQLFSTIYGIYISFKQMYITYNSLALIMLSGIPITLFTAWIAGKLQYKVIYIDNSALSALTNFFGERLPNILHIKTCNMEDEEYQKGVKANNDRFKAEIRKENHSIFIGPISTLAQYINQIVLLVVATALVRQGTMKMFQLVNLYNYFLLFMSNAFMLSAIWQGVKTSHGTATTIAKLVDAPSEDLDGGQPVSDAVQDITFEHVSFSYDGIKPILSDASFSIPKGKVTAIVGKNGGGKSTIIKLLERFNESASGTIRLGENKLADINLTEWRNAVGYLFQGDQMIKGSIAENIAYGINREYTQEELIQAAKLANAYDFIMAKDNGFDTEITRFDTKCSGGEMQRIAIARMIMKQPQYLIMDEATSGIDVVNTSEVLDELHKVMHDKTIIMVCHDMSLMRKADHIVVLDNGAIEASGTFEEVSQQSSLFAQFLNP